MSTVQLPEIVLSAAEVAKAIGVELWDLQKLHPADFGSPGHWRMNRHSVVVYTVRGVMGLEEVLIAAGRTASAARLHSKLVEEKQSRETPSRLLIEQDWHKEEERGSTHGGQHD